MVGLVGEVQCLTQPAIVVEPTTTSPPAQPDQGESHRTISQGKLPLNTQQFTIFKEAIDDQILSTP